MTEGLLSAAAALLELGLPLAGIVLCWRRPPWRRHVVVALGSLAPLLGSYAWVAVGRLSGDESFEWAFAAMWVMSFWPYVACLALALLVSIARRPHSNIYRFCIGVFIPMGVLACIGFGG